MLQNIRDNAQGWLAWTIVILIAIPFALWGIHEYLRPTPKRIVAEVNGVELTEQEFQRNVYQRQQQLRAMFQNQDIDLSFMADQIRQTTLEQMIEEEVLIQSAFDAGMRISDAMLVKRIHEFPAFQEDGVFSQTSYEQALSYQGLSPMGFEKQIGRAMLTDQFRKGILRSALLTTHYQEQRARLEEQQRLVSYLIIPTSRFTDSITITDEEIESYYHANTKQYMTPEKVSIKYVELSKDNLNQQQNIDEQTLKQRYQERKNAFTTPAQWKARHILIKVDDNNPAAAVQTKAQEILSKIQAGESFESLAQEFSDDRGSQAKGGDLGWFGPGTMVKPFEDALKTMTVGEVSEPVKSQFGFHIIKLEAAKPETVKTFAEAREQLTQQLKKEQAEQEFYGQYDQFANLAYEHRYSLEVVSQSLNLKTQTTGLFDRQASNQSEYPILSHSKVIEAAFSDEVLISGENSEVIEIGEQHLVVLRVKDHEPAQAKPLVEVKEDIVTALTKEKTQAETNALGKRIVEQLKQKGDLGDLAKNHHLNWLPARWVKRDETTLKSQAIVREAFKMGHPSENKALYKGIELADGDYALIGVLAVKEKPDGSEETVTTDEQAATQSKQMQQALAETEFNQLISGLVTAADIKNFFNQLEETQ